VGAAYHAHDVSRLLLRQQPRAGVDDVAVFVLGFSARKASYGNAWRVSCDHLGRALPPHLQVQTALDNAEEILLFRVLVRLNAAVEPAHRTLHGLLHAGVVGRGGDNHIVKLHHDVGADGVLQGHGVLGGEQHGAAVVGAQKANAFLGHFGEFEQRHHLEAGRGVSGRAVVDYEGGITDPPLSALVSLGLHHNDEEAGRAPVRMLCGHDWSRCAPPIASSVAWPGLRPLGRVSWSRRRRRRRAVAVQMVGVVETQPTALVLELLGREALQRRLRGHGHEDGQRHRPVGQMERCCARLGDLASLDSRSTK
jgi:hypothetical protein